MKKSEFDESWPHNDEGRVFADPHALEELLEPNSEVKSSWKTLAWRILGLLVLILFFTADSPKIRTFALAYCIFLVYNKVDELIRGQRRIRRDLELIKGSIRTNRFLSESRNKNTDYE